MSRHDWLWFGVPALFVMGVVLAVLISANGSQVYPLPLTYPDLPQPIRDPATGLPHDPHAAPLQVRAGDRLAVDVTRCVTDDGGSGLGELSYSYSRALYDAHTGQKVEDMPGDSVSAALGCNTTVSSQHYVPADTPPGVYYLAGASTAVGLHRTATVGWRIADFEVVP